MPGVPICPTTSKPVSNQSAGQPLALTTEDAVTLNVTLNIDV